MKGSKGRGEKGKNRPKSKPERKSKSEKEERHVIGKSEIQKIKALERNKVGARQALFASPGCFETIGTSFRTV